MKKLLTCMVFGSVFILSACGGGGGGATLGDLDVPLPDTVIANSGYVFTQGERHRASMNCSGLICTVSVLGQSETVDLLSIDLALLDALQVTDQFVTNGVQVVRITGTYEGIRYDSLAAWGEFNSTDLGRASATTQQGVLIDSVLPTSGGFGSHTNPVTGSASWSGVMVGSVIGGTSVGPEVFGDANLSVDFSDLTVDLYLTDITRINGGSERYMDMTWLNIPMRNGKFSSTGLLGQFYGPNHEEAGGVFERNQIVGGFSLKRL